MDGRQTCELCSQRLPSILHLNAHRVRKHLLCLICPFQASSKDTLFQHFTETKHRHPCHACGTIFATTEGLTEHDCKPKQGNRSAQEDLHTCSTCTKTFPSADGLKKHKIVAHLICVYCGFKAQTDYDLVEHFILTGHRHYCHACGTAHETVKELNDHECKPMILECGNCDMSAPYQEVLDQHHVDCTATKLICRKCKMVAPDSSTLTEHEEDCKPEKIICATCEMVAPTQLIYDKHYCKSKKIVCTSCRLVAPNQTVYERHAAECMTEKIVCTVCKMFAPSKQVLEKHGCMPQKVVCDSCQMVAPDPTTYASHTCIPNGFACPSCKMVALDVATLIKHNCMPNKVTCASCKMVAPDGATYNKHIVECKTGKETCPICGVIAPDWTTYVQHWTDTLCDPRHSNSEFTPAHSTCKGCNNHLRSMAKRDTHLDLVHGCRVCHTHNSDNNALLLHMQVNHSGSGNIKCIWCYFRFDQYSQMLHHVERGHCQNATHDTIDAAMARIPTNQSCMYEVDMRHYDNHGYVNHNDVVFYCEGCQRDFRYLSSLFSHTENSTSCPQKVTGKHIKDLLKALRGH